MATPFTSYAIQKALKVTEDGRWGPETETAMRAALGHPRDNTNRPWGRKRLIIAFQQKLMREAGIQVELDGLLGPETLRAFEQYQDLLRKSDAAQIKVAASMWSSGLWGRVRNWLGYGVPESGHVVVPPAGPVPASRPVKIVKPEAPAVWPRQRDVPTVFGPVGENQRVIICPWEMGLSWDVKIRTRRISLHQKVAPSAERALQRIWDHYGPEGVKALGLDKFGGSLNVRKMRGGDSYSMHSWGIAIDFDPDRNQFRWDHTQARLARPDAEVFWQIWEDEGWVSLGRARDFDWMHVQAARL